ncbi:hypothetical protein Naga_100817g3 [Nannochloropsis gaditana]|uniref:Uncharacterized protein n=1 Tax=Nannochloropsis gaditana TaxID=72520 RepID=W7TPF5_9STRA|nr:hypothetical protein Naga_100817g3 [Nannochloropsis gaditana]
MPVDRMMKKTSTPHQAWGGAKRAKAFYAAEKQDQKKDGTEESSIQTKLAHLMSPKAGRDSRTGCEFERKTTRGARRGAQGG